MKLEMRTSRIVRLGTEMPQSHVSNVSRYFGPGCAAKGQILFSLFFLSSHHVRAQGLQRCRVEKHDGSRMEGWKMALIASFLDLPPDDQKFLRPSRMRTNVTQQKLKKVSAASHENLKQEQGQRHAISR